MKVTFKRVLAAALCLAMAFGLMPLSALAYDASFESETHNVFSRKTSTIAPGVTQDIVYAYSTDSKQMAYYVLTADIARDDVVVQTSYYKQHENGVLGMETLTNQMAYAKEKYTNPEDAHFISEYYTPVAGVNASFFNMSTGQPLGVTYIDGVSFGSASYDNFFAVLADGTAVIDYRTNESTYTGDKAIVHAVAGSQWIVRDGKDVTATITGSYNTDRHCRTAVGVTADGQVVMMSLDGRQEPFSCGGSMHEIAQIMLEAGCVAAINLDGGGSTTFAARQEGEDEVTVVNRPSDGSPRAISAGLIIASTTPPSDVFDRAYLEAANTYVTPGSTVNVTATGVSPAGTAAEIPDNAQWQLENATMGTVENGVFVSNGTVGDAVVQMTVDGTVVGETTIHVVIPDLTFDSASMTVPYNKTFTLKVSGTTNNGLNEVVLKDSDLVFELSDAAMGIISGTSYTTCDASTGLTGGEITVKCVWDETKTATATVTFGKASVIVEDFEDNDMTGWASASAYARAGKGDLTYGRFESHGLQIVNAQTGKVRNGNYAMEILADFSTTTASGYKAIKYTLPAIDLTGATTFGMWMYLPVVDVHYLEFDIGGYEYYIEDDATVTEDGWYYITAPASSVGSSVSTFTIYMVDPDENYFNVFNTFKIYIDDLTVDYSNATEDREIPAFSKVTVVNGLDSETALSGQTVTENTLTVKAYAAEDLSGNYTGLDLDSARVYVDGTKLSSSAYTCDENGIITVADLTLNDGMHTFRFEIDDNAGNTGFVTKQIAVNSENGDVYVTRRSTAALPLAGSVEYFDVVAENVETVDSVTLTLDLDTLNIWELQGADVLYGFNMTYSVDSRSNTATVVITKTGDVEATGEAVLAALPVRIWQTTSYLNPTYINAGVVSNSTSSNESTVISTPYVMWQTDRTRLVRIELSVQAASVVYANGDVDTFSSEQMNIITELNRYRSAGYYTAAGTYVTGNVEECKQGKDSTHVHTATAIDDKAATCTEAGYTDRTYCAECNSVIDWGTTVPATGHTYVMVDGVLQCEDGDKVYNGVYTDGVLYINGVAAQGWIDSSYYVDGVALTGVQAIDGVYYNFGEDGVSAGVYTGVFYDSESGVYRYAKLGTVTSGWQMIDDEWYYFRSSTMAAAVGEYYNGVVTYVFEETGRLTSGVWYTTDAGTRYYYGPTYHSGGWKEIDGETYYFNSDCYRVEGYQIVAEFNIEIPQWYQFDENGALIEKITSTGILAVNGNKYYLDNGISQKGLYYVDGYYYYFDADTYAAVKNGEYTVEASRLNGLDFEPGVYTFNEEGQIVIEVLDGFVEENGGIYYYVNGELQKNAGLILVDGDYYYVRSTGAVATGRYYVTNNNGLKPSAYYDFDETGKMIVEKEPEEEVKNGFVTENGAIYYYVDGVLQKNAGLILVDGDYYYVRSTGAVATGRYYVTNNNGIKPSAYYDFEETGKMIVEEEPEEEVKNGFVTENGGIYYYVDGVLQKNAGLILVDGDYYYVRSTGAVATGRYYVTNNNGIKPSAYYDFDETGKMVVEEEPEEEVKNGFVTENGGIYYYVDGVLQKNAGLILVDGDYYYVRSTGAVATGRYYVTNNNGIKPSAYYDFDETGKMVL